jgi:hypothetical protein
MTPYGKVFGERLSSVRVVRTPIHGGAGLANSVTGFYDCYSVLMRSTERESWKQDFELRRVRPDNVLAAAASFREIV